MAIANLDIGVRATADVKPAVDQTREQLRQLTTTSSTARAELQSFSATVNGQSQGAAAAVNVAGNAYANFARGAARSLGLVSFAMMQFGDTGDKKLNHVQELTQKIILGFVALGPAGGTAMAAITIAIDKLMSKEKERHDNLVRQSAREREDLDRVVKARDQQQALEDEFAEDYTKTLRKRNEAIDEYLSTRERIKSLESQQSARDAREIGTLRDQIEEAKSRASITGALGMFTERAGWLKQIEILEARITAIKEKGAGATQQELDALEAEAEAYDEIQRLLTRKADTQKALEQLRLAEISAPYTRQMDALRRELAGGPDNASNVIALEQEIEKMEARKNALLASRNEHERKNVRELSIQIEKSRELLEVTKDINRAKADRDLQREIELMGYLTDEQERQIRLAQKLEDLNRSSASKGLIAQYAAAASHQYLADYLKSIESPLAGGIADIIMSGTKQGWESAAQIALNVVDSMLKRLLTEILTSGIQQAFAALFGGGGTGGGGWGGIIQTGFSLLTGGGSGGGGLSSTADGGGRYGSDMMDVGEPDCPT